MTEAEQNRLVIENMGLVSTIAADFRGGEIEFDDLLGAGREGLVKAARSYNPALGTFSSWAGTSIRSELLHAVRSDNGAFGGDSIEKIFDWSAWGDRGNANAISEAWMTLESSPEELLELYEDVKDKRNKFAAAFISLSGAQRKLVRWVYLDDPRKPITQAARDLGVSYRRAVRMLQKALKTMRNVIERMEQNSGGNTANGRPSLVSHHGCVPGSNAAA